MLYNKRWNFIVFDTLEQNKMKKTTKKIIISGTVAAAITASATLGGCSLISTDSFKDLEQIIATVNVSKADNFDAELAYYKDAVDVTASIQKRELITYFVNVGYSYIQNYGYTYEQVFNLLIDSLVSNAIMTQYATMYLLNEKAKSEGNSDAKKAEVLAAFTDPNKSQAKKYEELLDKEDIKIAKYSLMSSLNSAIDSYETQLIKEETSEAGSDTRATPENVDTEKEDYYPAGENETVNYKVYTGFGEYTVDNSGAYKTDRSELLQKHSTTSKRITAYNNFISGLVSYNLVDIENENIRDLESLKYYEDEYVSRLEQRVIEKYYDIYEDEQEKKLNDDQNYEYVQTVYDELLELQEKTYEDEEAFNGVLGNLSDSSFLLYTPQEDSEGVYGYVYNILLPFNQSQSVKLTQLQSDYKDGENEYKPEYYTERNKLLNSIVGYDQRAAWFNGSKEYAFKSEGEKNVDYYGNSDWLFFKNNLTNNERYENLKKYAGKYSYNGVVVEKTDERDDYVLYPNPVTISNLVTEFSGYVNCVIGSSKVRFTKTWDENIVFNENNLCKDGGDDKEIDYSKFLYGTGYVDFKEKDAAYNRVNALNPESEQYKALSAVNELQYAYTTDTSVLSQYLGYSVQVGDTSYIKEFEYAAHEALERGAGSFSICGGNYGWHLIYVTYTFSSGEVQHEPKWADNVEVEGTFENLFYEWLKSTAISDISTKRRSEIIEKYQTEDSVIKYVSRYQALLDIDKKQ